MTLQILTLILQREQVIPPMPIYNGSVSTWQQVSEALHMSFYRVMSLLVAVLPGLLACVLAVIIFALIGMVASALLRWLLTLVKFDDRFARVGGGSDWSPSTSPTALVGRASFWSCVLLGLLIGISAFDASYAAYAALSFNLLPYVAHLVSAIVILIVGTLIARFLA